MLICYIIHYTKLTERRASLERQLAECSFPYPVVWVIEYDREVITAEQLTTYIALDFNSTRGVAANAIAHLKALEWVAQSGVNGLILEDDLIFGANFLEELQTSICQLPNDWDMAFLSEGCDLHAPNVSEGQLWYNVARSRCANCYLVRHSAAWKLWESIKPVREAIDHAYNEGIKQQFNVYWREPTIAWEGSKTGEFIKST